MRRMLVALALASLPAAIAASASAHIDSGELRRDLAVAADGSESGQNTAASDRLTLDLYWEYETVSDPQLSPDGSQIIYTRQWIDKVNDRRESSLWIMNVDGSKNRVLVRGSNARWSPSGDRGGQ